MRLHLNLILATVCGWSVALGQEVSIAEPPAEIESCDAGDLYFFGGQPIRLNRSVDRLAVKFRKGLAKSKKEAFVSTEVEGAVLEEKSIGGERELGLVRFEQQPATDLEQKKTKLERSLAKIKGGTEVDYASPVLVHPATGRFLVPTDEIIVKVKPGVDINSLTAAHDLELLHRGRVRQDEYILRLKDPKSKDALEIANQVSKGSLVQWAEPNFVQEIRYAWNPNDPLFADQWHLNDPSWGIDVDAPEAWNLTTGSSDIVIAVIDTGIESTHEDLSANIFTNSGETAGDEVDNDGNGYVDDHAGWDFADNDNDPSPGTDEYHGTAVAGVAAGRGNNGIGISGACPNCRILPIRLPFGTVDVAVLADAIEYGGSLADVLSNSWTLSGPSSAVQSAIQWATANGREGKGCPVLFASGNSASGLQLRYAPFSGGYSAGTWTIRIDYAKDASGSAGDDTAWLAWVFFSNGEYADFESGWPSGWTTGGTNGGTGWSIVNDPAHTDEGNYQVNAAKAGTIADNQTSYIEFTKTFGSAWSMAAFVWVSCQSGTYPNADYLRVKVTKSDDSFSQTSFYPTSSTVNQAVGYPAAHPESIAVGASTDWDYRSHYSQFGPQLSVLAPSSGGPFNLRITTTDRTGTPGYSPTNYYPSFGGTSSATPLASGVVGLMLSKNPNLTAAEVRQILQDTADKVGPEPYSSGRNDRYGYGRVNAFAAVTASDPPKYVLSVSKDGNGSGAVSSSPDGIDCGSDCTEEYTDETVVTLSAAAGVGSYFAGWSGAGCSGTGTCVVSMTDARSVTATFSLQTFDLSAGKAGTGSGTVTSSPSGIDCGSDCNQSYSYGTIVTLSASASTGSTFTGWSGACTGTDPCQVIMDSAKAAAATFTLNTYSLTVSKTGTGGGTVNSSPPGIACGADCAETYGYGSIVTLTAGPDTGSTFTGWSGACTGTGTCQVTMDMAKSVTAQFTLNTYALSVSKTGTGSGTVSSSPPGISCGADCAETYDHGTIVTLTASPDTGSSFTGWSGGCAGTGSCQLTMDQAQSVTARFDLPSGNFTLGGYLGVGTETPARAVHLVGPNAVFRMDRSADTAAFILSRTDELWNPLKTFVVGANSSGLNQGEFIINDIGAAVGGMGQRRLTITNTGETIFGGNVTAAEFLTPSSLRLKQDIRLVDAPVFKLRQLTGVRFDWKQSRLPGLGLLAEEVAGVLPEAVFREPGGKVAGLDYDGLLGLLLESSKAQLQQIRSLQSKREQLRHLLEELQKANETRGKGVR